MSRLIDADKVLVFQMIDDETEEIFEKEYTIEDFIDKCSVDGCPKPVDAEPIIRCKDCKYWNKHHFVDIYVCSIHNKEGQYPYLLFEMSADDFCSRGERRDEID